MSQEHPVSRRASLKSLGTMGAVLVLGQAARTSGQTEPKPPAVNQGKPTVDVVDVAMGRFAKGHS